MTLPRALLITTLLLPIAAQAQVAPHARDGHAVERLQSIDIPAIPGAPFSATVLTDWTRVLEDNTHTTIHNIRTVARDSTGRVFEERRYLNAHGDQQQTPLSALEYTDPVRHERTACNPTTKICLVEPYLKPAASQPTTHPEQLPASVTLPNGAGTITRENLGTQTIDNVQLQGSREITIINPGTNGYQHPEPTVKEFWYSPQLDLNVIVKRFEPRGGAQNFAVTHINLNEPNPNLFTPPADYKIVTLTKN